MSTQQEIWKKKVDLFRKRFGAREDVFGTRNVYYKDVTNKETGEITREESFIYSPQCENYGNRTLCQITRNIGKCTGCPNKKYQRLTDEWIWKHISGQKDLLLYMVTADGIKFGACDFDYGSHFEDAKLVRDKSISMGLPCYIARSSKKGYHLYWFFSTPVPAHNFTSLISHIYEQVGFLARYRENPALSLPETFPKQTFFEENKIGNGIKPPMIEPKMRDGFNCWVDDDASPISHDKQWEFLLNCQEITPDELAQALIQHSIDIIESPVGRSGSQRQRKESSGATPRETATPKGDFWNIVNRCPALKVFWDKDSDGAWKFDKTANEHGVPHMARVASLSLAVNTVNGADVIRERWSGARTEKEIRYAEDSGQHPWTCQAMQDHGLCKVGIHPKRKTHCLDRIPPAEKINGKWVTNPNQLPESEWPNPSPSRFSSGFIPYDQLIEQYDALFAYRKIATGKNAKGEDVYESKPPEKLEESLHLLHKSSKLLKPDDQKRVQDHLIANKYISNKDMKALEKRVQKEIKNEEAEERRQQVTNFTFGNNTFFMDNNRYVMQYLDTKGIPHETELTNFTVEVKEEIVTLASIDETESRNEQTVEFREFKGVINIGNEHKSFRVPANDWIRSSESFFSLLVNKAGGDLLYNKSNYDHIRNCINFFSRENKIIRKRVRDFGHYLIKGEHTYITPSVVVTRDEIRPNVNEFDLEFHDASTKPLDFKIIDDAQFKDLALHIITDYFECNSMTATMTTFAHSMAAAAMSHIPLNKSPVLWLNGSFSSGKSFIAEMAQCFYGNFDSLTGMNSTGKGKLLVAHNFRNSLLVIDDFKSALSDHNAREMIQFIHSAYDRSGRAVSKRDGTLREDATRIRGMIATTGEEYPAHEASAISRMLLVDISSNSKRIDHGEKVKDRKHDYCGFTPHFIQFIYNMGKDEVKHMYNHYFNLFEDQNKKAKFSDSGHRISENLAFNMTAFRLAMDLLVSKGVIPIQRRDEFCRKHVTNLEIIRTHITTSVTAQKGANLFLDELKAILQDPSKYHITNWHTFDPNEHKNSKPLGFYRESTNPDVVFIYPSIALGEVGQSIRKSGSYLQTKHHIARQLVEDGHIEAGMWDVKNASYSKQVTTPTGSRTYCWAIKLDSIGFSRPGSGAVPSGKKEYKQQDSNILSIALGE
jgi:hypothetical protein